MQHQRQKRRFISNFKSLPDFCQDFYSLPLSTARCVEYFSSDDSETIPTKLQSK